MRTNALGLIGNTPVVRLLVPEGCAEVWAKIESRNIGGSVKDRIALAMIEDARERGVLAPGHPVVEATSGNTGIGLAVVCAALGHPLTLVFPESVSPEGLAAAVAMGARTITTSVADGMAGSILEARRIAEAEGAFWPRQFENPANPACHERTTGPEIARVVPGPIDAFVGGIGTGGTVTGVGRYLKRLDPRTRVIGVEPAASPVISGGQAGAHRIQGIGAGFIPPLLERSLLDGIELVEDLEAWNMAKQIARRDGLFVGVSSGAAAVAAMREAVRLGPGRRVVTLFPDGGDRYVSLTPYFEY